MKKFTPKKMLIYILGYGFFTLMFYAGNAYFDADNPHNLKLSLAQALGPLFIPELVRIFYKKKKN